jgi:transposase
LDYIVTTAIEYLHLGRTLQICSLVPEYVPECTYHLKSINRMVTEFGLIFSMSKQPLVPTNKANQLIGSVLAGSSNVEAAHLHDIMPQTANNIIKKCCKTGSVKPHTSSGCEPIITPQMKRHIKFLAKRDHCIKFHDIGKQINPKISASSVWRILAEEGYHQRKARKVLYLTPQNEKQRHKWAKKFEGWGSEDWERVIWSDEVYVVLEDQKRFCLCDKEGRQGIPQGLSGSKIQAVKFVNHGMGLHLEREEGPIDSLGISWRPQRRNDGS